MTTSASICYFSDARYVGGAEMYLRWLLQGAGPERASLVAVDHPGLNEWLNTMESAGFAVHRLRPEKPWRLAIHLYSLLRELRPTVFHANLPGPYDGIFATASFIARLAGVPRVVVTEHLPSVGAVGKRFRWKRMFCGSVDMAIALCKAHQRLLIELFGYAPDRTRMIHNGVPSPAGVDDKFPGGADRQARGARIVQVGALENRKGGRLLIEAASGLSRSGHEFELWFVGSGSEGPAWEKCAEELGIAHRVHFAGQQERVGPWLSAADIVVLASEREGMPLSLLEAMCVGKAVVASSIDGIPDLVVHGETGLLVAERTSAAFEGALGQLVQDAGLRDRMGSAAAERFQRQFRLERMLDETFALYGGD